MKRSASTGWTFAIVSIALFMVVLDNLVVTNALPSIKRDLGATIQQLEWTVNAYTLSYAVLLLTGAALGDRFGRKRMFSLGLGIFTLASASAAVAPSTGFLIAARAAQGLGAAIVTPLTLTLLSEAVPAEKRGLALGAWSGISGLAVALGPVVGGAVVTGISWHWIFWLNVPIGLATLPLAATRLTESHGESRGLDLRGLVLASAGLGGVVYGVVHAQTAGWTAPIVLASLIAGALLVAAFVAWELRAEAPMLPMEFFRRRAFAATNGVSLSMYFGTFGSIFLLSQFFQVVQHYSALQAGLRILPWTVMPIFIAPLAGALSDRIGGRPLMAGGLALQAGGLAWLASIVVADGAVQPLRPRLRDGGSRHGAGVRPGRQHGARRGAAEAGRPGLGRDQRDPRAGRSAGRERPRHGVHGPRRLRLAAGLRRRPGAGGVGWSGGAVRGRADRAARARQVASGRRSAAAGRRLTDC